jgi:hypothetical protein
MFPSLLLFLTIFALLLIQCQTLGNFTNLEVPYIHQEFDTRDSFCGHWACGPTSSVMAVAYFGKIKPHPINVSHPTHHTSQFGWYVSSVYKSNFTGVTFNMTRSDSCGKPAHGAYAACTEKGRAFGRLIQDYLKGNGLQSKMYSHATFDLMQNAIKKGHLVVLSTQLTPHGHLVLIRGFDTTNGKSDLLVNDPWGNKHEPDYGKHRNGENVRYSNEFIHAKWMIEVWQ